MLRRLFTLVLAFSPLLFFAHLAAQSPKDPLNDDEIEQVREYANQPNERLKLYQKFIDQRIEAITRLSSDKKAPNRTAEIRARMEEFTSLVDELQDNLDTYDHDHADIRKALKSLAEASPKWEPALHLPETSPIYDFDRKSAIEAATSAVDQIKQIQNEQEKYFIEHKDQAGKNGTGPQGY